MMASSQPWIRSRTLWIESARIRVGKRSNFELDSRACFEPDTKTLISILAKRGLVDISLELVTDENGASHKVLSVHPKDKFSFHVDWFLTGHEHDSSESEHVTHRLHVTVWNEEDEAEHYRRLSALAGEEVVEAQAGCAFPEPNHEFLFFKTALREHDQDSATLYEILVKESRGGGGRIDWLPVTGIPEYIGSLRLLGTSVGEKYKAGRITGEKLDEIIGHAEGVIKFRESELREYGRQRTSKNKYYRDKYEGHEHTLKVWKETLEQLQACRNSPPAE